MTLTEALDKFGGVVAAARALNIPKSTLQYRIEKERAGIASNIEGSALYIQHNKSRIEQTIKDGVVVVFSDAHFWPGDESTAFLALLKFIENFKPVAVVNNGDAFDGATVSRWPVASWEDMSSQPTVRQEIEACQEHLARIEEVSKGNLVWCLGNHDARFEMRLVSSAPQYAGLHGTRLKDYFPRWQPCWSHWINNEVIIKHRFRSGVHAGHNNTVNSGKTIVTGHTHQLEVKPFSDYNGTRYGVQTGTLSDLDGQKFGYAEDNPQNHRSGFIVLTFRNYQLMQPETVSVFDNDHVDFRGRLWKVR